MYTRSGAAERSFVQCAVQREWEGEVQLHQRGIASRHCLDGEAFVWLCQGFFNPQHHQWAGHSYRGVPPLQHKSETTPWVEQMLSGRPGEEKGQIWGLPWLPECLGGHCWAFKGLPTEGSWKGGTDRFFAKSLIWIQIDKWPILNLLDQVHFSVHMTTLWLFGLLWEDEEAKNYPCIGLNQMIKKGDGCFQQYPHFAILWPVKRYRCAAAPLHWILKEQLCHAIWQYWTNIGFDWRVKSERFPLCCQLPPLATSSLDQVKVIKRCFPVNLYLSWHCCDPGLVVQLHL